MAIKSEIDPNGLHDIEPRDVKLVVHEQMAWMSIIAADLLKRAGMPVIVGNYEKLTGRRNTEPEGFVRLFCDVPQEYQGEMGAVLNTGGEMVNRVIASGWPTEHSLPLVQYAMKRYVEQKSGLDIAHLKVN